MPATIHGISAGNATPTTGRMVIIRANCLDTSGQGSVLLKHESTSATAAYRLNLGGSDLNLHPANATNYGDGALLVYNGSRWQFVALLPANDISPLEGKGPLLRGSAPTITSPTITSATISTSAITLSTTTNNSDGRIAWDATNDHIKVGTGSAQATFVPSSLPTIVANFTTSGTIATNTGAFRWYNDTGKTLTIGTVRASVGTAPTGASLICDVNVNGTTIFSTQSNRPTIAASSNTATSGAKSTTTISNGQYFTMDVDQVGSTIAGSNLSVTVYLSYI